MKSRFCPARGQSWDDGWAAPAAADALAGAAGLIAGLYPAIRAASLDPITALRHE